MIASPSKDGTICVWDRYSGEYQPTPAVPNISKKATLKGASSFRKELCDTHGRFMAIERRTTGSGQTGGEVFAMNIESNC
jgi:hypothetical protein